MVWRGRRLATLLALGAGFAAVVGAGLVVTAGAASAADERVDVRASRSFTAGGDPGTASVTVSWSERGCVFVRTALSIRLDGMDAGQVRVEAFSFGGWRPVAVSGAGDGVVVTERTPPDNALLCNRQSAEARYRIAFDADTRGGSVTIVGEAYGPRGRLLDRDAATGRVNGTKPSPTPSRKSPKPTKSPTRSPTPTPTPTATAETATAAPFDDPARSPIALGVPNPPQDPGGGGFLGMSRLVMAGGLVLVAVGVGLIVFLIRQIRADRAGPRTAADPAGRHALRGGPPATAEAPTIFLPGVRPATGPGTDPPTVILPRIDD